MAQWLVELLVALARYLWLHGLQLYYFLNLAFYILREWLKAPR